MKKSPLSLPLAALILTTVVPLVLYALLWVSSGSYLVIFLLFMVMSPFVGMGLGIASLCEGRKKIGNSGIIISVIAVAVPVIFVAVVTLLMTTGALVIGM